jgi:hypothetical protein
VNAASIPHPEVERPFLEAEGRPVTLPEKILPDSRQIAQDGKFSLSKYHE